jgi:two-component system sensor histidine kinase/response regulator
MNDYGGLASLARMNLLVQSAPIGMFMTDSENRFIYTNPRWSEITGLAPELVLGKLRSEIIEIQARAGHISKLPEDSIYNSEMTYRVELRLPGLAPRIVQVTSKSIPGGGRIPAGWVGTVADVTAEAQAEIKMAEARDSATEASRMKSDFLANISHEVRTPMNGVIGMADLLLETDLDTRQREFAQALQDSGKALLWIVNEILDFSRLEAGKISIESSNFEVRTVLDEAVMLLAASAQEKGLDLVVSVARTVPEVVIGDPGRLRQVLTNLVGNAIKFTQIGEVVVRVTSMTKGNDAEIKFEIADTGDGIPPEKLEVIFQPFTQADTSVSRTYEGAGLGLSISRELVALMGGDCEVSSDLDVGSTFVFTIRAIVVKEAPHTSVPHAGLVGISALIVDDSASQRGVLADQLADWGISVSTAASGNAAIDLLKGAARRGRPFEIALIDQLMPEMDGLQVVESIRSDLDLRPKLLLMRGLNPNEGLHEKSRGGIVSLSKPIRFDNLLSSLIQVLDLEPIRVTRECSSTSDREASGVAVSARILLVEDNVINQKVAAAMLTGAGYVVETVNDGSDAVQAVKDNLYDAILMDCQMPGLNGYEATAAIRILEGSSRRTPIIAVTAGARPEDRERCFAEGMDDYLAKPLKKDSLLSIVAKFVAVRT